MDIEIKSSRKKIIILIFGALLFVVVGVFFTITPETFVTTIFKNASVIRGAGIAGILFFGFCFIFIIKIFFTNEKFNLIITDKGIIDNSSYSSVGMIEWEDIISIKSSHIMSTNLLLIYVKDPEKYINSKSKMKKMTLKSNFKAFGTPISISSNALNYDFNKLEKTIINSYNIYCNNNIVSY